MLWAWTVTWARGAAKTIQLSGRTLGKFGGLGVNPEGMISGEPWAERTAVDLSDMSVESTRRWIKIQSQVSEP